MSIITEGLTEKQPAPTGRGADAASAEPQGPPVENLEQEGVRRLSNQDRDIFLTLLDSDPEPTEAAKEAAARFKQGRHDGARYHFKA